MGGWKLEVARMSMYVLFPVGVFYYFNQPQYFEQWIAKIRGEMYPSEDSETETALQKCIKDFRDKRNKRILDSLKESE